MSLFYNKLAHLFILSAINLREKLNKTLNIGQHTIIFIHTCNLKQSDKLHFTYFPAKNIDILK